MTKEQILALDAKKHVKIWLLHKQGLDVKEIFTLLGTNRGHVHNEIIRYKADPERRKKAEELVGGETSTDVVIADEDNPKSKKYNPHKKWAPVEVPKRKKEPSTESLGKFMKSHGAPAPKTETTTHPPFLHIFRVTEKDGEQEVKVYRGEYMSAGEAMGKLPGGTSSVINHNTASYKYFGASKESEHYKRFYELIEAGQSELTAFSGAWQATEMGKGGAITKAAITSGAKFKTKSGIVWIIDKVYQDEDFGTAVRTSMEGGEKGNYRDSIEEVIEFLNEESAVAI